MKNIRRDRGITLIALIITIIVLLILAGIVIATLAGDNGIITQARNAKNKHNAGQADEEQKLGDIYNVINDVEMETETVVDDGVQIFSGAEHIILLNNETIQVCGVNWGGQLGLGDYDDREEFETVSGISGVKQVSAGGGHTVLLMNDGTINVCGYNEEGQLGLGDNIDRNIFITAPGINEVKQVSAGAWHTVLLMNDGTIKVSGTNRFGQLGLGDNNGSYKYIWSEPYIDTFETVPGISGVKKVSAGAGHTVLLMEDGTIKVCGWNGDGQLGLGDDDNRYEFETVNGINGVKQVSAGESHTVLLMNDGTIKVSGDNYRGQLGLGDNYNYKYDEWDEEHKYPYIDEFIAVSGISGVKQVSAEAYHTMLLMNDGTIKVCGYNEDGQLGLGDDYGSYKNVWGEPCIDEFTTVSGINRVKQVSTGHGHTALLMNNGTIKIYGIMARRG